MLMIRRQPSIKLFDSLKGKIKEVSILKEIYDEIK